jgi:hypothetical protein
MHYAVKVTHFSDVMLQIINIIIIIIIDIIVMVEEEIEKAEKAEINKARNSKEPPSNAAAPISE